MKRLRLTLIFLFAALFLHAVAAGQSKASAATILSSLRSRMASAPAVEAVFTINGGQGPVQGSVILSGAKYSMTTPQMSVWYDGRTQWTFLRNTNEVSITEPSADELLSTNPFAILSDQTGHALTAPRLARLFAHHRQLCRRRAHTVVLVSQHRSTERQPTYRQWPCWLRLAGTAGYHSSEQRCRRH